MRNKATRQQLVIRAKLSLSERIASKVFHNSHSEPIFDFISETIARPAGLLGGSLLMLVSLISVYCFTNYFGYDFNYLLVLLAYPIGFTIGIILELLRNTGRK